MSQEISNLKDKIKKHMENDYLDFHLDQPLISEERLHMLSKILDNAPAYKEQKSTYIIPAMLVQAALDTHDSITVHNEEKEGEQAAKDTQLTVLAGDYYSGLYYLILSQSGDISFIRLLADAIKEINELKMGLYHSHIASFAEFSSFYSEITSQIVTRVASFTGYSETVCRQVEDYLEAISYIDEIVQSVESGKEALYDLWLSGRSEVSVAAYQKGRAERLDELLVDGGLTGNVCLLEDLYNDATRRWQTIKESGVNGKKGKG